MYYKKEMSSTKITNVHGQQQTHLNSQIGLGKLSLVEAVIKI